MDLDQLVGEPREREPPRPIHAARAVDRGRGRARTAAGHRRGDGRPARRPPRRRADPWWPGAAVRAVVARRVRDRPDPCRAHPARARADVLPGAAVGRPAARGRRLPARRAARVRPAADPRGPLALLRQRRLVHDRPGAGARPARRPGHRTPTTSRVYLLAAVAQAVGSLVHHTVLAWLLRPESPRETAITVLWSERIDAMLSPIGYLVAAAAPSTTRARAWPSRRCSGCCTSSRKERSERYAAALELHQTYRGTVMVLSDVVEADDNYTASHCRAVVELAVATAEEIGLDRASPAGARDRRPAPRRRQDRDPQGDPEQAGQAHRRGVRADEEPHGRGPGAAQPGRRPARARRRDRPLLPRALGRPRLPRRAARRGDPARRSHRLLLRRLLGDDDPTGPTARRSPGGGDGRAARQLRHAVRAARRRRRSARSSPATSRPSAAYADAVRAVLASNPPLPASRIETA